MNNTQNKSASPKDSKDIIEIEHRINAHVNEQLNKTDKIPYDDKPFQKTIKKYMLKLLGLNK